MNPARYFLSVAAFLLTFYAGAAPAQTAHILVGFAPGGALDALARIFQDKLSAGMGRTFVVENRPGAGGRIANLALKNGQADGNTIMVVPDSAITLYPHTTDKPPYDTLNDFVPLSHAGSFGNGLAVGMHIPPKTLKEWIDWVKLDKKNAVYGAPSPGSNQHFLGFMLSQEIGVRLEPIVYKGVGPALKELMGGHVPAVVMPLAQIVPMSKAGKMRVLAQSTSERPAASADIPTFKELGYPKLQVLGWYLFIAKAGTPPDVVTRYNEVLNKTMREKDVRDRMHGLDLEIHELTSAQLAAQLEREYVRWQPVVKASGFKSTN